MADPVTNALRRKLAAAEATGDTERADAIRKRMSAPADAVVPSPDADVEVKPAGDGLDDVAFASPAAREAAKGMSAEQFKRRKKSSDAGFTKADVERIAAATDEGDE